MYRVAAAAGGHEGRQGVAAHLGPNVKFRTRVTRMLNTCDEIASTAQWAATDPAADANAVMNQLVLDFDTERLDLR